MSSRLNQAFQHKKSNIKTLDALKSYGIDWDKDTFVKIQKVVKRFPMKVTPYYLSLSKSPIPHKDPILLQCIPDAREIDNVHGFQNDPIGEDIDHSPVPKLIQRYPDRAVIMATNQCATFCRHCNRKRLWRQGKWAINEQELKVIVSYLRSHTQIKDVIISGGDPLMLDTDCLEEILWSIRQVKSVEIIRIGSRVPVTYPMGITREICRMLAHYGPLWLNTQFNSPLELTQEAGTACENLLRAGIPVNNQSVLIKGVNDTSETMAELCKGLLKLKVRPYYLFHCEPVEGLEHLRTPVITGVNIIASLRGRCSGLGIPTYVIDVPGGGGKVPLSNNYLVSHKPGIITLRIPHHGLVYYPDPK